MRTSRLTGFLFVVLAGACARPVPQLPSVPQRIAPWDPATVAALAELPLQDGGRVKPFATLAAFALYFTHGRRDLKYGWTDAGGGARQATLEPTEWLLDVWCFPDQAADYPLFRIEHTGVLDALGIANEGQSLDFQYLSYRQLLARAETLQDQARAHRQKPANERTAVEEHLVQSFEQLAAYHRLHQSLQALHADFAVEGDALRAVFGGASRVTLPTVLEHAAALRKFVLDASAAADRQQTGNARRLLEVLAALVDDEDGPALFPPLDAPDGGGWHGLGDLVDRALRGGGRAEHTAMLAALRQALGATDVATRDRALLAFRDAVRAAAPAERQAVALETGYYRQSWHYRAIHGFLFGFLLAAAGWLVPKSRALWWASLLVTGAALAMLVWDIGLRCVITGRPPIKNLYDTFLFIAAVGVLTALVVECVLPRRITLALAPVFGALVVMFARLFEVTRGEDTMAPLVAVLDSNFWLATHVTTINIGYAAGLIAALLGNAWIGLRALRLAHPDDPLAKALVRMAYGVTCFGLLFALVGTILGGVWANDSWGRFWGWDPKENGALLICIAQIALLHARMGGLLRDFGIAAACAFTGVVVLFSWFHTNLLGVGLHNYGFSSGLHTAVWTGYWTQAGFLAIGALDVLLRPHPARAEAHGAALPAAEV